MAGLHRKIFKEVCFIVAGKVNEGVVKVGVAA